MPNLPPGKEPLSAIQQHKPEMQLLLLHTLLEYVLKNLRPQFTYDHEEDAHLSWLVRKVYPHYFNDPRYPKWDWRRVAWAVKKRNEVNHTTRKNPFTPPPSPPTHAEIQKANSHLTRAIEVLIENGYVSDPIVAAVLGDKPPPITTTVVINAEPIIAESEPLQLAKPTEPTSVFNVVGTAVFLLALAVVSIPFWFANATNNNVTNTSPENTAAQQPSSPSPRTPKVTETRPAAAQPNGGLMASRSKFVMPGLALDPAVKKPKPDVTEFVRRAVALQANKEHAKCVEECTRILDVDPDHQSALLLRAVSKGYQHDFDGAIADASALIDLNKTHADAYYYRGVAYLHGGTDRTDPSRSDRIQLIRAIADFDSAVQYGTKQPDVYWRRGCARGKYAHVVAAEGSQRTAQTELVKTISDFTTACERQPGAALPRFDRALAFESAGNLLAALADLTEAIRLEEGKIEFYVERSKVYQALRRPREAREDYLKAQELQKQQ